MRRTSFRFRLEDVGVAVFGERGDDRTVDFGDCSVAAAAVVVVVVVVVVVRRRLTEVSTSVASFVIEVVVAVV